MSKDKAQNSMVRLTLTIDPERSRMGQNKSKCQISNVKTLVLVFVIGILDLFCHLDFDICHLSLAQEFEEETKEQLPEVISRPNIEYKAGDLRDPFEGYVRKQDEKERAFLPQDVEAVPSSPPPLAVQGVMWGGKFPQAIVNDKVVKVGDTIEGARIIEINKNGVTVFFGDRQYNLSSPAAVNLKNTERGVNYEE